VNDFDFNFKSNETLIILSNTESKVMTFNIKVATIAC